MSVWVDEGTLANKFTESNAAARTAFLRFALDRCLDCIHGVTDNFETLRRERILQFER